MRRAENLYRAQARGPRLNSQNFTRRALKSSTEAKCRGEYRKRHVVYDKQFIATLHQFMVRVS